jgi:hypothetical protein
MYKQLFLIYKIRLSNNIIIIPKSLIVMKQFHKSATTFCIFYLMLFISSCSTEDVKPFPPSIGTFTIAAKRLGSAPFVLTPPTSNSAGAFTYSSANASIATISGSTVTVVGVGTTTITAVQAANAGYGSTTITATFTVSELEPPTFGSFNVPSKMMGSAPFQLTAPTSNSGGAFSYTSSNTSVATISGSTVTVVGVGTSTITALQATFGTFASGTTTATFTVAANIPAALLQENFEYPASTILSDISGSGWAIHSGSSFPIQTTSSSSLSFANYYGDGLGLAAILDANGADSNKQFVEQSEGTPIYISFVVKIKAPVSVALTPPTSYFLHTSSLPFVSGSSSTFRGQIFSKPILNDLTQYNLGLSFSATSPQQTNTTKNLNYDQNYLVVLKYNSIVGSNNDSVSLYVFSETDNFATEPTQAFIEPLYLASAADIKSVVVCLRQFDGNQDMLVDAIRVTTVWNFRN